MGIGVKRPKIDTTKIDSLLGSESPLSQVDNSNENNNIVANQNEAAAPVVETKERVEEVKPTFKESTIEATPSVSSEETEAQHGIMDVSEIHFESKSKNTYSCEQKLRVVLPSLDSIIENKSDEFSMSRTSNITLPDSLIKELQALTLLSRKKAYTRNILSNIVTTFLAAYKKDIESARQRKSDNQF